MTINGPSSAFDCPTLNVDLCSFVIFQGIRTSIAKKLYIFVIFQRVSGLPPPLWTRPWYISMAEVDL